ncbi:ATP-binding protein [Fabibacter sp. E12]|nr:ATP-binding protein [Roseivirga sp. E12]
MGIVGPESTGKTTLAKSLANHFQTEWVKEYAREYLTELGRSYTQSDLVEIAKGQVASENRIKKKAKRLIFLDTDLLVIKIWSEFKYGSCDPWIEQQLAMNRADLYLLTDFDIPYEDDPLRESPNQRGELFEIYKKTLIDSGSNFHVVKGDHSERLEEAIGYINLIL